MSKHYLVLKSATDDPLAEGGAVLVKWLLGYRLPFSAPLCHISDRAGSHQKVTWHWAFSSIPKKPSSTHLHSLAIAMSVEAKKNYEKN